MTGAVDKGAAFGVSARLRSRIQLDAVRNSGSSAAGRLCVVALLKTPPDGTRRVAFLISRRFSLLAVERNRARRLFRESWRRLYSRLPESIWISLIPRRGIKKALQPQVQSEIEQLLYRMGVQLAPLEMAEAVQ